MTESETPVVNKRMILASILCMAFGPSVFLLMPIYTKMDKTKPVPERVTK